MESKTLEEDMENECLQIAINERSVCLSKQIGSHPVSPTIVIEFEQRQNVWRTKAVFQRPSGTDHFWRESAINPGNPRDVHWSARVFLCRSTARNFRRGATMGKHFPSEEEYRGTGPSSLWRGCRARACNRPGFVAHSFVPWLTPGWTRACGRDTIPDNGHNEHGVDRLGSSSPWDHCQRPTPPNCRISRPSSPPDLSISRRTPYAFPRTSSCSALSPDSMLLFSLDSIPSRWTTDFLPFSWSYVFISIIIS